MLHDRNPRTVMRRFWRDKYSQTKGTFSICSLLPSIRSACWRCLHFRWLCHKTRADEESNASAAHGMSNFCGRGGLRHGGLPKTTLAFYQPGVSAGLYEGGGFLSKTHDWHFVCLAYDLFLKMALTRISCKWPIASWERLGSSAVAFEILMTI